MFPGRRLVKGDSWVAMILSQPRTYRLYRETRFPWTSRPSGSQVTAGARARAFPPGRFPGGTDAFETGFPLRDGHPDCAFRDQPPGLSC